MTSLFANKLSFPSYSWTRSQPKIDLVLAGEPGSPFSWAQREGWARALIDLGMLNRIFWVWDNPNIITHLFESLKQTTADFVMILSGDHHQYHLHNTPEKKHFWKELKTPVVCHCAERILGSPFKDSEQKTRSALATFDVFVYIDELSASLFDQSGKPSLWITQYVDETVFVSKLPYEERKNQIHFRGQWDNFGIPGVYEKRRRLIERVKNNPVFDISEAYKPLLTIAQAVEMKAGFRFALCAPANCTGYAAVYEALACGCVAFQYELFADEKRSRSLLNPGYHFISYDPEDMDKFISEAEYAVRNWQDFKQIAEQGREECLAKHTIKKRMNEILKFLEANWSKLLKQSPNPWVSTTVQTAGAESDKYSTVETTVGGMRGDVVPGQEELPIHFFTIVLNGEPFIRHHIEVFKQLPFKWHWHIIEGVADLKHDTAWSLKFGARITDDIHKNGLSNDGTTKYLDDLEKQYSENVTIYRKQNGTFWDGKLEMVNAPLKNIGEECLLWQIDADELWTVDQLCASHFMFRQQPEKTAAYYFCHYFVGKELVITTRDTYGNYTSYEWLRTWRFRPGDKWMSHEPPRLSRQTSDGQWIDISSINSFKHADTEQRRLVFQHYAYATEAQLYFKERYFGYQSAVSQWKQLRQQDRFPVFLRDFFAWVKDDAQVNNINTLSIHPVARKNIIGQWRFRQRELPTNEPKSILWIRTDSIGDAVLSGSMLPHIHKKYSHAGITVVCQTHIEELYKACPFVDDIITFDRNAALQNESYLNDLVYRLQALNADLALNSVFSREQINEMLSTNCDAKEKIAMQGNLSNISAEVRNMNNVRYTKLLPSAGEYMPELKRHKDFLKGLGIDAPSLKPVIWLTEEDEKFADDLFTEKNLKPEQTVALFAGAQYEVRLYEHYGLALSQICRENGFTLIGLGAAHEYRFNEHNIRQAGVNAVNLTGKLTLRQTAAIIKRCRLAVGAETGLAHIACAVGTPNIILLGGGHFGRFMPYSPLTSIVCLPLECYGCDWNCRYERVHCVRDVLAEVYAEAIQQTIEKASEKPRIFIQGKSLWNPVVHEPVWEWSDKFVDISAIEMIKINKVPETKSLPYAVSQAALKDETPANSVSRDTAETILIATNLVPFKDARRAELQQHSIESITGFKSLNVVPLNICFPDELILPDDWEVSATLSESADMKLMAAGKRKPFVTDLFNIASDEARRRGMGWFIVTNSDIIITATLIHEVRRLADEGYETMAFARTDVENTDQDQGLIYGSLEVRGYDVFACKTAWWENNKCRFLPYIFGERAWDNVYAAIMACHSKFHIFYTSGLCFHFKHDQNWEDTGAYADYNMSFFNGPDKTYSQNYSSFMDDIWNLPDEALTFEITAELISKHFPRKE
jgi:ADP-heptose:LPS heptosyltransferase